MFYKIFFDKPFEFRLSEFAQMERRHIESIKSGICCLFTASFWFLNNKQKEITIANSVTIGVFPPSSGTPKNRNGPREMDWRITGVHFALWSSRYNKINFLLVPEPPPNLLIFKSACIINETYLPGPLLLNLICGF